MKKLSETYKELGIDFSFPIEITDAEGNRTYYETSFDYWRKYEYDADGKVTYFEDSDGLKKGTPKSAKTCELVTNYDEVQELKGQIIELRKMLDEAIHLNQAVSMLAGLPTAKEMDTLVKDGKRLDWLLKTQSFLSINRIGARKDIDKEMEEL